MVESPLSDELWDHLPSPPQSPTLENFVDSSADEEDLLSLDGLAHFIARQLQDPQAHIPANSTNVEPLVQQTHVLSVEEALDREDLQVPDVLSVHSASIDESSMEDLTPDQRQIIYCGFDSHQEPEERIAISVEKDAPPTQTAAV
jgi:hypothetical protein